MVVTGFFVLCYMLKQTVNASLASAQTCTCSRNGQYWTIWQGALFVISIMSEFATVQVASVQLKRV